MVKKADVNPAEPTSPEESKAETTTFGDPGPTLVETSPSAAPSSEEVQRLRAQVAQLKRENTELRAGTKPSPARPSFGESEGERQERVMRDDLIAKGEIKPERGERPPFGDTGE